MTRQEARQNINDRMPFELTKAKRRVNGYDTYICPLCENGSGTDGDGICTKDGKHYKCFRCNEGGDYLELLKKKHGTNNENDIFKFYGLEIDGSVSAARPPRETAKTVSPVAHQQRRDYLKFILKAAEDLKNSAEAQEYLKTRGISLETAARLMVGYCPDWRSPAALLKDKNPPKSRRIILPTSRYGYTARSIDSDTPKKYRLMKEGQAGLFNRKALYRNAPVYIVESATDALSIIEVGGEACALGSTSGTDKFLETIDREPPTALLLLSLDNDKAGQDEQTKLKAGLVARNIPFYEINAAGEHKDANEYLVADRAAFTALIKSDPDDILKAQKEAEREAQKEEYKKNYVREYLLDFTDLLDAARTDYIPIGFKKLDSLLDGGFYEGLYILGAISSLGKSTFALQVANQISAAGTDVLFFSLEMSKYELTAKSISALTFEMATDLGNAAMAKSVREITTSVKREVNTKEEATLIFNAIARYSETSAQNLCIFEGSGSVGVEQIRDSISQHISITGKKPIVIVDYLQILAPHNERASDKQNADWNVSELKRISRDFKVTIFAISSFNRDNYNTSARMEAFKESGGIEYGSDVLFGLQFEGVGKKENKDFDVNAAKQQDPRKVELIILKNRNGTTGARLTFDYYARFNLFKCTSDTEQLSNDWKSQAQANRR